MDKPVYIEYLDHYIPETKLNLADCPDLMESIGTFYSSKEEFLTYAASVLYLQSISVEQQLDLEKMVMLVLDRYMRCQGALASTVKYLIIATDYSNHLGDYGHHILRRLGMPRSSVFRLADNYCVNIDLAVGLATKLLRAEAEPGRAIIIAGLKHGKGLAMRVVGSYGILGDSAGMMVLSNEEGSQLAEVGEQAVVNSGDLADMDLTKDNTLLHLRSYSICLKELLSKSGLLPSMVDQVVIHNANEFLLLKVLKSCGIKAGAVNRSNQGKFGHLGSCDLILNLKTILEQGGGAAGNIVSLNLGIIGTYVSTLFKQ